MQVIHELRNGVKLRKISEVNQQHRHIEFELTPFEILLDQIRTKRYHLRKVIVSYSNKKFLIYFSINFLFFCCLA